MIKLIKTAVFIVLGGTTVAVLSKSPSPHTFRECVRRTEQSRFACQAGCGMIVQQCYDETVADAESKISVILSSLERTNGGPCADLAKRYLDDASRMEQRTAEVADRIPGWIGSDMKLNLMKQRLINVQLIAARCNR